MDNAENAIMMAFGVLVLLIALSLAMFMFSQVLSTSEVLAFYADSTSYYDNVEIVDDATITDADIKAGTVRIVNADTIIPTLYRYYKENFCVKIYDASNNLIQIFDVNLEGKANAAIADTRAKHNATEIEHIANYAYNQVYNKSGTKFNLFGAPWLGSTESVKTRIDLFVDGKDGYINNTYVDYSGNDFYQARIQNKQFKERFISYSYSGQTMTTEDGDKLVTGETSKDKVVIIYTLIDGTGAGS